jgi:replicative DNA helicase
MSAVKDAVDDRVLPHSLEAERSVLGAILLRNEGLDEAAERLTPADFYRQAHRTVYGAMLSLAERREAIDLITVREELGTEGLNAIGGPAYLAKLVDGVPRSTNVSHYAEIVKEKATRRAVIAAAQDVLESAYDTDLSADDVVNAAEQRFFRIDESEQRGGLMGGAQLVDEIMPMLQALMSGERRGITGVPSGFGDLDALTTGFQPGDLILVAARPSVGKSAWVSDVSRHLAISAAHVGNVGFWSVEMSRQSLTLRNIVAQARVDGLRLRSGYVSTSDYQAILRAAEQIRNSKLFIDDSSGLRPMELRSKARRFAATQGLSLIIIDYLQLMRADKGEHYENRNIEVAGISRSLKAIAKELQVPVIAVSQLTREVEKRADKRPNLGDLRDSGSLEQDADMVLFLHRDGYYDRDADQGKAECIIAKQRNGPTGVIDLTWLPYASRFENYVEGGA